jgi:hypothetical protein
MTDRAIAMTLDSRGTAIPILQVVGSRGNVRSDWWTCYLTSVFAQKQGGALFHGEVTPPDFAQKQGGCTPLVYFELRNSCQ